MRVRGRRVVLLIAGALPLLAENDLSREAVAAGLDEAQGGPPVVKPEQSESQQDDQLSMKAAEALHEQPISLLPLNLLQMESNLTTEHSAKSYNTIEVDLSNETRIEEEDGDEEDLNHEVLEGIGYEHPDEQTVELVEDAQEITDDETAKETEEIEPIEEASADHIQEEAADDPSDSDDLAVDEEEMVEEQDETSEPETVEAQNTTDTAPEYEGNTTETIDENAGAASVADDDDKRQEEDNDTQQDSVAELAEAETDDTAQSDVPSERQQPTPEPQVDKLDEDEDGSISERVAVDYASKSAGALVLEKSPNFKGTSNLLNGDRDKYAISPCEDKKFVILSLSEDILVKQVKLANYELYSSRVKDFQIQISQTMGNWVDIGSYTASPASGVQVFDLSEPAWGRYLKFKFSSHYGDEYYCTLSQVMVHGSTMVQGFHEHLQESSEEDEEAAAEVADEPEQNPKGDEDPATIKSDEDESDERQTNAEEGSEPQIESQETQLESPDSETNEEEVAAAVIDSIGEGADSASNDDTMAVDHVAHSEGESQKNDDLEGDHAADDDKMSTKKTRNSSTALPAASIGLSSDVFTTIIGKMEPLHLKSIHRLSTMRAPAMPDSQQFQTILAKASDSTKAFKKVLTEHALLDNLPLWNEPGWEEKPFPPEAFGSIAIGPREQTLSEKLAAYIENSDDDLMARDEKKVVDASTEVGQDSDSGDKDEGASDGKKHADEASGSLDVEVTTQDSHPRGEDPVASKTSKPADDSYESLHDTDLALATLLDKLPSIECLKKLDFVAFKEKALASRKGAHGAGGHTAAGHHQAEPIFKLLTDQIKALQSSLSVHDQFTKDAVQCYQRVLLDVVVELQTIRFEHEARLSKLEEGLEETRIVRWIFVLYQLVMGLPNWVSLVAATFFTTFVSPNAVTRPLEHIQSFLGKHVTEGDRVVLSWTIKVCIMVVCIVATVSLCHRLLLAARILQRKSEGKKSPKKSFTEENSCRFVVETADGEVVAVTTRPHVDSDELDFSDAEEDIPLSRPALDVSTSQDRGKKGLIGAAVNGTASEAPIVHEDISASHQTCQEDALHVPKSPSFPLPAMALSSTSEQKEQHGPETEGEVGDNEQSAPLDQTSVPLDIPRATTTISAESEIMSSGPTDTTGAQPSIADSSDIPDLAIELEVHDSDAGEDAIREGDDNLNNETREVSGARTPEVEADISLETMKKVPVSPSSVAKVSEFANTPGNCSAPEQELGHHDCSAGELQREDLTPQSPSPTNDPGLSRELDPDRRRSF